MKRIKQGNIISRSFSCKGIRFYQTLLLLLMIPLFSFVASPQDGGTGKWKAEKQQARRLKEAERQHKKDLQQHINNQSKETKKMMKKSKRSSKKKTPVKPKTGKKCQ